MAGRLRPPYFMASVNEHEVYWWPQALCVHLLNIFKKGLCPYEQYKHHIDRHRYRYFIIYGFHFFLLLCLQDEQLRHDLVGSWAFMAPEVLQRAHHPQACDLWVSAACGVQLDVGQYVLAVSFACRGVRLERALVACLAMVRFISFRFFLYFLMCSMYACGFALWLATHVVTATKIQRTPPFGFTHFFVFLFFSVNRRHHAADRRENCPSHNQPY